MAEVDHRSRFFEQVAIASTQVLAAYLQMPVHGAQADALPEFAAHDGAAIRVSVASATVIGTNWCRANNSAITISTGSKRYLEL